MAQSNRMRSVAVIIPTYNRARLLPFSIDSVLRQTRPADDIVVVNDGSTDSTAALLQRYGKRIRRLSQKNQGKAAALNKASGEVTSDYIWIMDDDDCATPDALERHLAFLDSHPEVDFSYSGLYFFKGNAEPPPRAQCSLWQPPEPPHAEFLIRAMEQFPANQQTMLVPRSCYQAVGAHDETLKFGEDYDMILRLARRYRAGRLDEPTIFLRRHSGTRGPASDRRRNRGRVAAWQSYNRAIFRKLRRELKLDEYLPRGGDDSGTLTEYQTRRALLQRACIMARRGLYEEALDDLAVCGEKLDGGRLTAEECAVCARMLNFDDDVQPVSGQFVRNTTRLLRRDAPRLLKRVLAGLYWAFLREVRAGHYRRAAQLGLLLFQARVLVMESHFVGRREPESARGRMIAGTTVVLHGRVAAGRGKGTSYVERHADQIRDALGESENLVNGSLNVLLRRPVMLRDDTAVKTRFDGLRLDWPARLNGTGVWLHRWESAPLHIVELLCTKHLRTHQNLSDGDKIEIEVRTCDIGRISAAGWMTWILCWAGRRNWCYTSGRYWAPAQRWSEKFGATQLGTKNRPRDLALALAKMMARKVLEACRPRKRRRHEVKPGRPK